MRRTLNHAETGRLTLDPGRAGILLLALVATATLSACPDSGGSSGPVTPPPPGSVHLFWQITELSKSCTQAGLTKVSIQFVRDGAETLEDAHDCSEMSATVSEVDPGNYTLTLSGLDAAGAVIYRSDPLPVVVQSSQTAMLSEPVLLTRVPAHLKISWYFANAHLCGGNNVATVNLAIYDVDHEKEIYPRKSYPCDYPNFPITVEVPPGNVKVIASAINNEGQAAYADAQQFAMQAGQDQTVELKLQACGSIPGEQPGC